MCSFNFLQRCSVSAESVKTKSGLQKDPRDTERRRIRHKDGRLLRAGMGLTTGLGWSDRSVPLMYHTLSMLNVILARTKTHLLLLLVVLFAPLWSERDLPPPLSFLPRSPPARTRKFSLQNFHSAVSLHQCRHLSHRLLVKYLRQTYGPKLEHILYDLRPLHSLVWGASWRDRNSRWTRLLPEIDRIHSHRTVRLPSYEAEPSHYHPSLRKVVIQGRGQTQQRLGRTWIRCAQR